MASSRSDGFKSHGELVTFLFNRFVVTSLLLEMDCELFADTCVRDAVLRPFIDGSNALLSEEDFKAHLRTPPVFTVVRVNSLTTSRVKLAADIRDGLVGQYVSKNLPVPDVYEYSHLPDVLIIKSCDAGKLVEPVHPHIIVGVQCGVAVLRGSQVYAPGVMGVPTGLALNDLVSVHADLTGQCLRGWCEPFHAPSVFVGNGILTQTRKDIFSDNPSGVAVVMIELVHDMPSMHELLIGDDLQKGFLQNLPSIFCGHILEPFPHHLVLDMCAAPGGKTTHIATLMNNQGTVVAIDKSAPKIQQIMNNAAKLGLSNIQPHIFDSTKLVADQMGDFNIRKPPFQPETFDRILLDAPCSALGQRPQLYNAIRFKELQSFPRLQKKLFCAAEKLLKVGGRVVYSTCTFTLAENEEIALWALETFPQLRLVACEPDLGRSGLPIEGLSQEDCGKMRRFGTGLSATEDGDTIGFFVCCFEKF